MCDAGETVSRTLKREFLEEATDSTNPEIAKKNQEVAKKFDNFFKKGTQIYKGYVDDPRNTDNAWMETVVQSFHDSKNVIFKNFDLKAGDDATNVDWLDIHDGIELYATHKEFIQKVAEKYKAHWSVPPPKPVKVKKEKAKKEKKDKTKNKDKQLLLTKEEEEVKEEAKEKAEEEVKELVPLEIALDEEIKEEVNEGAKEENKTEE